MTKINGTKFGNEVRAADGIRYYHRNNKTGHSDLSAAARESVAAARSVGIPSKPNEILPLRARLAAG